MLSLSRAVRPVGILAGCLLLLAGCNLLSAPLEPAAASYYNYMQGLNPEKSYAGFTSPAFRKSLSKESLAKLDDVLKQSRKKNPRASQIKRADIVTAIAANFGLSAAGPDASFASRELGQTQWVKDGGRWYLFLGSDAEVKKYGQFPVQLKLPPPKSAAPADDPDAPQ
jgi:hypothetical protein